MDKPAHLQPSTQPQLDPQDKLKQLLKRPDLWRGRDNTQVENVIDTGYETLNDVLVNRGWPIGTLIEVCQSHSAGEWLLFSTALKELCQSHHYIALLNPPILPYAVGLIRNNLPLNQIIIITPRNKNDFIASFVELSRSSACCALMAWQPKQSLNYTELRKCQLASVENNSLQVLFRHRHAKQQSSPASLRLTLAPQYKHLQLQIFKQRGLIEQQTSHIKLPKLWQALPPHPYLDGSVQELQSNHAPQKNNKAHNIHSLQGRLL